MVDLGTKAYADVWQMQKELVAARVSDAIPDTLILVEHEHVITLGRKTSPQNLRPQNVPVFQVERGGDATYHGPGQLVGYPIMKMAVPDVKAFVRKIEEVLILALRSFSIAAGRMDGHSGVWVGGRKIASIGIAVTNWVTYHGFALNINTDLGYFHLIKPCGLDPDSMTSMERVAGRTFSVETVKQEVLKDFCLVFQTEVTTETTPGKLVLGVTPQGKD